MYVIIKVSQFREKYQVNNIQYNKQYKDEVKIMKEAGED